MVLATRSVTSNVCDCHRLITWYWVPSIVTIGSFARVTSESKNDFNALGLTSVNLVDSKYTISCPSAFLTVVCTKIKTSSPIWVGVAPNELVRGNKRKTNPNKKILFIKLFNFGR